MKTFQPPLFYKVMFNGNYLEEHPSIISYESLDDQGFNHFLFNKGNSIKDLWPSDFTIYLRGHQPIDYFICGMGYTIMSNSAAEIIYSVAKDSVELLPVKAVLNDNFIGTDSYYILNVLKSFEALNWQATVWTSHDIPYDDPSAHFKIIKPAFNSQLIQEESIFLLTVNKKILHGIFISKYLKELLEDNEFTVGMEFRPIKTNGTA